MNFCSLEQQPRCFHSRNRFWLCVVGQNGFISAVWRRARRTAGGNCCRFLTAQSETNPREPEAKRLNITEQLTRIGTTGQPLLLKIRNIRFEFAIVTFWRPIVLWAGIHCQVTLHGSIGECVRRSISLIVYPAAAMHALHRNVPVDVPTARLSAVRPCQRNSGWLGNGW